MAPRDPKDIISPPGQAEADAIIRYCESVPREPTVRVLEHEGLNTPFYFDPSKGAVSLEKLIAEKRPHPLFRAGCATIESLDTFIEHTNRFKSDHSALWASEMNGAPRLSAVFDYHEKLHTGKPGAMRHTSLYDFPLSEEWKAWTATNGRDMGQREFAEFLEERLDDVISIDGVEEGEVRNFVTKHELVTASPIELLKLSKGLKAYQKMTAEEFFNTSSGESEIRYSTENNNSVGGKLDVPTAFVLSIPVFQDGAHALVLARLRYRIDAHEQKIKWSYKLAKSKIVLQKAFRSACVDAGVRTDLPLFFGTHE